MHCLQNQIRLQLHFFGCNCFNTTKSSAKQILPLKQYLLKPVIFPSPRQTQMVVSYKFHSNRTRKYTQIKRMLHGLVKVGRAGELPLEYIA